MLTTLSIILVCFLKLVLLLSPAEKEKESIDLEGRDGENLGGDEGGKP